MATRHTAALAILGLISGLGMALAAWLLTAPDVGPPPAIPFQDKAFHALGFACLTAPAVLVLPRRYQWFWLAHMLALGAGIEIVQALAVAGRSGDVLDFLADAVGIAAAFGVGRWIRNRFEEPVSPDPTAPRFISPAAVLRALRNRLLRLKPRRA